LHFTSTHAKIKKETQRLAGFKWGSRDKLENEGALLDAGKRMSSLGFGGVNWLSLCDPLPGLKEEPPWVLNEGLAQASLLSRILSPKAWMEEWLYEIRSVQPLPEERTLEFVDVSHEEYLAAPEKHLSRLWMRFKEGH
jgi:hypothetical protein